MTTVTSGMVMEVSEGGGEGGEEGGEEEAVNSE